MSPPTPDITSVAVPRKPAVASSNWKYAFNWPTAIAYNMKSIASSIQPTFAAASTRHCSAVIVRYHGAAVAAADDAAAGCVMRMSLIECPRQYERHPRHVGHDDQRREQHHEPRQRSVNDLRHRQLRDARGHEQI